MAEFVYGAWVFDGRDSVLENGCLVIEEGRVVELRQMLPGDAPRGSRVTVFDGSFIMPGFIDAHNHLGLTDSEIKDEDQMADPQRVYEARARTNVALDLSCGITTQRELGDRDYLDVQYRDAIRAGQFPGPRLLAGGPWIAPTHGHGAWALGADIADGVEEVRKAVRRHIKAGADVVKLMISGGIADSGELGASYYSRPEIEVAVTEAHNLGVRVAAHCYGGPGVRMGVEAGVDTFEHASLLTSKDIDLIADKGAHIVFTVGIVRNNPLVKESAPVVVRQALAAGANVGLGADGLHGNFAAEGELLVQYGASPLQALAAMTSGSAAACGVQESVGSLGAGMLADLVVLDGNPVEDISALHNVRCVMKAGQVVVDKRESAPTAASNSAAK